MKKRATVVRLLHITNDAKTWGNILTSTFGKPQHLYITTDDEIKEGDWYLLGKTVRKSKGNLGKPDEGKYLKIIATTDPELIVHVGQDYTGTVIRKDGMNYKKLPQPPKSFIEEYCKAGGIDEVDVEYIDDCCNFMLGCYKHKQCNQNRKVKLKIDSNNEIIIHPIEEKMYNETELIQFVLNNRFRIDSDTTKEEITKWIKS